MLLRAFFKGSEVLILRDAASFVMLDPAHAVCLCLPARDARFCVRLCLCDPWLIRVNRTRQNSTWPFAGIENG